MADDRIYYQLSPANPAAHYYQVRVRIPAPDPQGQRLTLPAWIPGSYMIRDFARNIVAIDAESKGKQVALTKLDKQSWQCEPLSGPLDVVYQVYAWDLSVRTAYLDSSQGFFNGTSLFLRVVGQENLPCHLELRPPPAPVTGIWRAVTTLPGVSLDDRGFGGYRADDYWRLLDHPVLMGSLQTVEFIAEGVPHQLVICGRAEFDRERLADDLERVCAHHVRFFGEMPAKRYLFMVMAVGDGYGGLEHLDSTVLICKRSDLPRLGLEEPDEDYRRFLGLCSHEYFHLWNVKRIRPKRLAQADLSSESHTRLLWAFEGITSYYDDLALVRCGVVKVGDYLETLAHTVTRVMRNPGRRRQSVAESSFDAWTKFYKQDENAPNAIVSYYAKGTLVAFGLDMMLRRISSDGVSLDELMRKLWLEYGQPDKPVPEEGIEQAAAELVGESLDDYFALAVHGTDDLPLDDWFRQLGIGFQLRPARSSEDKGGYCETAPTVESLPVLGASWRQSGDFVELLHVFEDGAAQRAGLSAGDRLVALDGLQITSDSLAGRIAVLALDRSVELLAFRRDELMRFQLRPLPAPDDTCDLWLLPDDECTPAQLARRKRWLQQ